MLVEYTGRQIRITPDLREYTEERLQKFHRAFRDHSAIHVVLEASKYRRMAEITLRWRDHTLIGVEETTDTLTSINGALDKLEKQAARLLQRKWTRKRRPGPTSTIRLTVLKRGQNAGPRQAVQPAEKIPVKPLSLEEAVETIQTSDGDPVVFRNTGTDRVNIVYWRRDGRLGLIEPQS